MNTNLIFVLDDSIKNSVFTSQVLNPLLKKLDQKIYQNVYIISFEKKLLDQHIIEKFVPKKPNLFFIQFNRLPFLGKISLYSSIYHLKKFLKNFKSYDLIARGPLAGFVAIHSINHEFCNSFKIQARGLLAAEYEYTYPNSNNILINFWHRFRSKKLKQIEREVYAPKIEFKNFCIEAVSNALKNYLIETFKANANNIIIANEDFPDEILPHKKLEWRSEIRKKINIKSDVHVYCYSGAIKAWQYPEMVVSFFKEKLQANPNSFLLILTQDVNEFNNYVLKDYINPNFYKILNVHHDEIYKYLSACDTGIIFRKKDIVSWVSRPVKAMEYKSVGLNIIHNNTVQWLIEQENIKNV